MVNHGHQFLTFEQRLRRGRQVKLGLLLLRAAGMCTKECAQLLGLGEKATEWHWAELRRKLGLWHPADLFRYSLTVPQDQWGIYPADRRLLWWYQLFPQRRQWLNTPCGKLQAQRSQSTPAM